VWEYEDGYQYAYNSEVVRGLQRNGKRPIKVYTNRDTVHIKEALLMALHPEKSQGIHPMYSPLGKYIECGRTLRQIWKNNTNNKEVIFPADDNDVNPIWYDAIRDGKHLDKDSAMEKYPEMFI